MRNALLMLIACVIPVLSNAAEPAGTRVTLSATVSENVANDEVVVSYRIEAKGSNAQQQQREVNAIAAKVAQRLKREKVRHGTTNRTLSPVWDNGFFSTKQWQMVQRGRIVTQDVDAMAGWLADIENDGARLDGLTFRVSDQLRKAVEDRLRTQAIRDFRAKASGIASALAAKSFRIIEMSTRAGGEIRQRRMESGYLAKSVSSAPALSAGESRIEVSVIGSIETPFRDFSAK